MNRLSRWLNERPYTKAMYLTALATIVMSILTGVMCWTVVQNSKALSLTEQSLSLTRQSVGQTERALSLSREQLLTAMVPSIHLEISREGSMNLIIQNTGVPDLTDLRLYDILYRFDTNNILTERKIPAGPNFAISSLKRGESITVPAGKYFDVKFVESFEVLPESAAKNLLSRVLCLAVVYRRQVDNRQFIHLEPTYPIVVEGKCAIGFLHQSDMTAEHLKGTIAEEQIKQITQRERLLFRIE